MITTNRSSITITSKYNNIQIFISCFQTGCKT